jgi:hypothetical protein
VTITLTAPLAQGNIVKWQIVAFDLGSGQVTVRFASNSGQQLIDVVCRLSDTANGSTGAIVNATPSHWDDRIISTSPGPGGVGGVGLANSLTNAQNAYRTAGNHAAGLRAVELQGLTDGWVASALTGT